MYTSVIKAATVCMDAVAYGSNIVVSVVLSRETAQMEAHGSGRNVRRIVRVDSAKNECDQFNISLWQWQRTASTQWLC